MNPTGPKLQQLEILRAFKQRMPNKEWGKNVSPFDERITTAHGPVAEYDISDIHAEVRRRIEQTIADVREERKQSQVILLAGDAGSGKTFLLRSFQSPERVNVSGYICVGGSNHWTAGEFEARLLDWMIEALTAPTPSKNHLLLERVLAIGFRAVDHLLVHPTAWQGMLARPGKRWNAGLLARLRGPSRENLDKLAAERDPDLFDLLDFSRFSAYVCDRFLADRSNLTHRYALRVLLAYLFPDTKEVGVGMRERVLHWFRRKGDNVYFTRRLGADERQNRKFSVLDEAINWFRRKGDNAYFTHRLGADERLDRKFSLFEAVKLLVHLFSPTVSKELSTEKYPCPPRVFLLMFDQAEGRNELFESEKDWMTFFAHLSELYNTLPNVVVLFTMTLGLRNRLHSLMERQFRDRIHMDEEFTLRQPNQAQVLSVYRSRVEYWLRNDPELLERYRRWGEYCLPFKQEQVLSIASKGSIRDRLYELDREFHREMQNLVVEPEFDYKFFLEDNNQVRESADSPYIYTSDHLTTVRNILTAVQEWLLDDYGVKLEGIKDLPHQEFTVLGVQFHHPENDGVWVCVRIVRFAFQFNDHLIPSEELLRSYPKKKHFLFRLRARPFAAQVSPNYKDQVFDHSSIVADESCFRGLLHLIEKKENYQREGQWKSAQELIRREIAGTYLNELFREARRRLNEILADSSDGQSDKTEAADQAES